MQSLVSSPLIVSSPLENGHGLLSLPLFSASTSRSTSTSRCCSMRCSSNMDDCHGIAWKGEPKASRARGSSIASSTASTEALSSILGTLEEKQEEDPKKDGSSQQVLADIWQEVQGSNQWEGLLDPINPILRQELIRYGEFAQACYDAFDFDLYSKHCGSCKFTRGSFFQNLQMTHRGYEVTKYLYATSNINIPSFFRKSRMPQAWSKHANWIGYVAVATDEEEIKRLGRRDIVIAWRGTITNLEWVADLMDTLQPAGLNSMHPKVKVETGFLKMYTGYEKDCPYSRASAREQVLAEIRKLLKQYKGEELSITVTGHSLGSALAMLNAYDLGGLLEEQGNNTIPITVFSFAGPRVGNSRFKERCEEMGLRILRVVNVHDTVPKVPGVLFNESLRWIADRLPWSYCHVGVELALDHTHSPYLKSTNDISCYHNLEAHLHLLDGYHGRGKRFDSAMGRDPALVNKSADFLSYELLVPPSWMQDQNKGLVMDEQGRWVQRDLLISPDHVDESTPTPPQPVQQA